MPLREDGVKNLSSHAGSGDYAGGWPKGPGEGMGGEAEVKKHKGEGA